MASRVKFKHLALVSKIRGFPTSLQRVNTPTGLPACRDNRTIGFKQRGHALNSVEETYFFFFRMAQVGIECSHRRFSVSPDGCTTTFGHVFVGFWTPSTMPKAATQ